MKRVPSYWWDVQHHDDRSMTLIVESDRAPFVLASMPYEEAYIEKAEKMIADLKAGRMSHPKAVTK